MRTFTKRLVTAVFALTAAFSFSAFAESATVTEAVTDSSIFSGTKSSPRGYRGHHDRWELAPYDRRPTPEGTASQVCVDANYSGCSVYLDGSYKGTTPCTIKNVDYGNHTLKISKTHCETEEYRIRVDEETKMYFWVELEKISGKIYFYTTPSNASVYCNDSYVGTPDEEDEGTYKYTVRAFGYTEWSDYITIYRGTKRTATISLDPCAFELTGFTCNKEQFNPAAGGKFSRATFTVSVTAPETGIFEIVDADGNSKYKQNLTYTTWNNDVEWDGKGADGKPLPDGTYTAVIYTGDSVQTTDIVINSQLIFQHMQITPDGSGVGPIGSAELYPKDTIGFEFDGQFLSDITSRKFGGAVKGAFLWAINDHLELSTQVNSGFFSTDSLYNSDDIFVQWSMNFKGGSQVNLPSSIFYWALNARIGTSTDPLFAPYGADLGNGIGIGAELGFTNGNMYYGFQSEFIFGAVKCALIQKDANTFKNGFLFQYSGSVLSFSAGAALVTGFGSYDFTSRSSDLYYSGSIQNIAQAVQGTVDLSFYLGSSAWCLDIETDPVYYPSAKKIYVPVTLGFSCFF